MLSRRSAAVSMTTLLHTKISFIRGYAANNSRALFRRRSSTTDYVRQGDHCQNLPTSMIESEVIEGDEDLLPNGESHLDCDLVECDKITENVEYPDYLDMNRG